MSAYFKDMAEEVKCYLSLLLYFTLLGAIKLKNDIINKYESSQLFFFFLFLFFFFYFQYSNISRKGTCAFAFLKINTDFRKGEKKTFYHERTTCRLPEMKNNLVFFKKKKNGKNR